MHLTGNHGAGSHASDYADLRAQPAPDSGEMSDDELSDYLLSAIRSREAKGITRHYSVNFLPAARHSDINHCLGILVERGVLRVSREYKCSTCGNISSSIYARDNGADCCSGPQYRLTSEFFLS
jgi:hypothetical protein